MKKFLCLFLILSAFLLTGCGGKEISSARITRDDARTGGSLSFVYDKSAREIYIGGEGEVIEYCLADLSRNLSAGNRIGLKIYTPTELENSTNVVLEMNGVTYSSFLETIDGQIQNYAVIYPSLSPDTKESIFKITWDKDIEPQTYKIRIVAGTKFLDENGEIIKENSDLSQKDYQPPSED